MRVWLAALTLSLLTLNGCGNLFEFAAPDDTAAAYVVDGYEALREGEYDQAIDLFEQAVARDAGDAEAHYGLAKAHLRKADYTAIGILAEITSLEQQATNLPFMDPVEHPAERVNLLYQGAIEANQHLAPIFAGNARGGGLGPEVIALDYTGTLALQSILLLRDTNLDSSIDEQDVNLSAAFDSLGNFTLDPTAWSQLSGADQQELGTQFNSLLNSSGSALDSLLAGSADDSLGSGFDTANLDSVLTGIQDGFNGFAGGGGPLLEGRPDPRTEAFVREGSR